jgi:hypothetical protein
MVYDEIWIGLISIIVKHLKNYKYYKKDGIYIIDIIAICICYMDVNWLILKISACRARIWSLLASKRSERVTNFIFCRAGRYFSVSIIFTFRWHTDSQAYNQLPGMVISKQLYCSFIILPSGYIYLLAP